MHPLFNDGLLSRGKMGKKDSDGIVKRIKDHKIS